MPKSGDKNAFEEVGGDGKVSRDEVALIMGQLVESLESWQKKAEARKKAEALADQQAQEAAKLEAQQRAAQARSQPVFGQDACVCPRCDVFAQQAWFEIEYDPNRKGKGNRAVLSFPDPTDGRRLRALTNAHLQACRHCEDLSLWVDRTLIRPGPALRGPEPHESMPDDVGNLYREARSICELSPRGAAALLRLALDKLLTHLEVVPGTLDVRLKEAKRTEILAPDVYNAGKAIKLAGDNGVHPGEVNLHEDPSMVVNMLEFLNLIVAETIARKKRIDAVLKAGTDAKAATRRAEEAVKAAKEPKQAS